MNSTPGGVFYANFVVTVYHGGRAFMEIKAKNADVDYNIVNNVCLSTRCNFFNDLLFSNHLTRTEHTQLVSDLIRDDVIFSHCCWYILNYKYVI